MKKHSLLLTISVFIAISSAYAYKVNEDLSYSSTLERIKSPEHVIISGDAAQAVNKDAQLKPGQKNYQKYCSVCHAQGVAGAPKKGDSAAWTVRAQQGWSILMKHAIQGYKGMPAKGHCVKCTDAEIKEAISYMLEESNVRI